MELFLSAAAVFLPIAYLLLVLLYGALFLARHPIAERWAQPVLLGTLALHGAYLVALGFKWHQFPAATVPQALSVVALAVALVYALVERIGRERSTGVWLMALVFLFQLLASALQRPEVPSLHLFRSALFATHVGLALMGYAAFVVAGGYGFLFLRLYRELKLGRFRLFYGRLPALEALDALMSGALWVGFMALTGATAAGLTFAYQSHNLRLLADANVLFTIATWIIYGITLTLRRTGRWQGRQTAVACLAGLAAIVVSLITFNFIFHSFHGV